MRVGLGKHFKPAPVLTRQTQAIFESVPTSAEEAATQNRDELRSQIEHIMKEEKRLVSPPPPPVVLVCFAVFCCA